MIEQLPKYIPIVFFFTVILTVAISYWNIKNSTKINIQQNAGKIIVAMIAWLALQAILSINLVFVNDPDFLPPKIFLIGVLPFILLIILLFNSAKGIEFIDSLSAEKLTYLSLVRIPVEFVLLWLFIQKTIPQILTFEGWNFDILMGLTAPLIIYFGYRKNKIGNRAILAWNILGVLLLVFVFIMAILSAPFPLQQLAFDQPNIGLLHFPFSWLPTFVVPVVILSHLVSIRQLMKIKNKQ